MKQYLDTTPVPWCLLAVLFLPTLPLTVYYILRPGSPDLFQMFIDILAIIYPMVLACLCFKGSRLSLRSPVSQKTLRRFSPILLGAGLLFYALAQCIWLLSIKIPNHLADFPSLQQLISLGMYPFFMCAILFLPSQNLSLLARLRLLFDAMIIMTAGATFYYYYLLAPLLFSGEGTTLTRVAVSSLPNADLVVIFCLLLVALRSGQTVLRPVLIMLGMAVLGLLVIHLAHVYEVLNTQYNEFDLAEVLYALSFTLIVGAAQTVRRIEQRGEGEAPIQPVQITQINILDAAEGWRAYVPFVLMLLFGLLVFGIWMASGHPTFSGQYAILGVGSFIILLLMILRQFLVVHEVTLLQRELQKKNRSLSLLHAQLEQLATADPLTGLYNHQALTELLGKEVTYASQMHKTCSIIFIDADNFKCVNDTYGHQAGDHVLCQFGILLRTTVRATDHVGRWGGEEFMVILPGRDSAEALRVAERIRGRVARQIFLGHSGVRLTCSLGLAAYPEIATDQESLVARADLAMYAAKRLGRNQARTARDPIVLELGLRSEEHLQMHGDAETLGIVEALLSLQEARDIATGQHERRVALLACKLAEALELSKTETQRISLGGLLHDLGKVALPDELLLKRQRLSSNEMDPVCQHPLLGAEALTMLPALRRIAPIVCSHHEWMDGSGYPDQLQGEEIPLGARIVAVASAYDVLTHQRAPHYARTSIDALHTIQASAGSQFDPRVVDALARVLAVNPLPLSGDAA